MFIYFRIFVLVELIEAGKAAISGFTAHGATVPRRAQLSLEPCSVSAYQPGQNRRKVVVVIQDCRRLQPGHP